MASQYDSIKTAEELLKEVAAHGLSTKPEDICRAQDIFGRSEVKELIRLANDNGRLNGFDGEPDPRGTYSSGRVGLSKYFYQVAFKIWSWEDATRFYNQHSNFPVIDALEENKMLHQQVKELNGELKRAKDDRDVEHRRCREAVDAEQAAQKKIGQLDMGWANNGKLNLRSLDWKTKLEGSITFAFARKMQFNYVRSTGGYLELREADNTYNDWNREQLRALKMMHGRLFLGSINFHGDQRKKVVAGKEGIYEELLDQMVYNFGCDFAVPAPDKELEKLIRAWNEDERLPKKLVDVEAMTGRVEQLGGINLIWY